jgi:DNA polymerase IV
LDDRQGNKEANSQRNRAHGVGSESPTTKFLAKLASDHQKPSGQFAIMPDEGEAFIANLAVARFHGVGSVTARKMHALSIETGADLRGQTLDFLRSHFGKSGDWYYELARGRDDRPVQADRERKSSGSETTFPEDLTEPARIEAGDCDADEVWAWCEKANLRGRLDNQFRSTVTKTPRASVNPAV